MSRILFYGDLAGTGFGTVTMDLGRAMIARGDDVRFLSLNEIAGKLPEPFESRTFRVGEQDGWLHVPTTPEEAEEVQARWRGLFTGSSFPDGWAPDAAILLGDAVAVKRSGIRQFIPDGFPAFHYVPIEGVDLPPRWAAEIWRILTPVACSEFGATEIEKITGKRPAVVYHGVDSHTFRPITPVGPLRIGGHLLRSRADCRRFFGGDTSRVWLLRTDRHMPRKRYNSMLRALVPVLARNPNVDVILHCRTEDQGGDLGDALSKLPAWFASRVISTGFHDKYGGAPREVLVALYNAADLYLSNCAEGFGLCIAESLACGTPAVGAGYSAVPEVVGPGGSVVDDVELFENEYDHYWAVAKEEAFGAAVEELVVHPLRRERLGLKGIDHVRRSFRWDTAAEQFSKLVAAALGREVAA